MQVVFRRPQNWGHVPELCQKPGCIPCKHHTEGTPSSSKCYTKRAMNRTPRLFLRKDAIRHPPKVVLVESGLMVFMHMSLTLNLTSAISKQFSEDDFQCELPLPLGGCRIAFPLSKGFGGMLPETIFNFASPWSAFQLTSAWNFLIKCNKYLKGNCHELRMYLGKFVCDNMPDFLATFRSRNLLFCLELSLLLQKAHHIRAVLPSL